jgi:hypothetical protein
MSGHPWNWIDLAAIVLVASIFVFEVQLIRRAVERIEKNSDFLLVDIRKILERIEKKLDA